MIRWSNSAVLLGILFSSLYMSVQAQDLFDEGNSRIYARHLYEEGKYELAAEEYGRLIKMSPDDSLKILFLKASRLSTQYEKGFVIASKSFLDPTLLSPQVLEEYFKLALTAGAYERAEEVGRRMEKMMDSVRYFIPISVRYSFHTNMLEGDWNNAKGIFPMKVVMNPEPEDSQYSVLLSRAMNLPHRSPALAASMSVVIPGAGKIYAGEWKDGLIAFFFTTFSAYQAVSAFQVKGPSSILGWIYTGVAAGFYTGGIYGSYKSAHRFNTRQEEAVLEDAKAIIFSTY